MWKIYSAKCDKDFVLSSDRELAHWILFLEFNPDVASFDLNPPERTLIPGQGSSKTVFDAEVVYTDGHVEWHEVKMGEFDKENTSTPQIDLQREIARQRGIRYVIFNDSDLAPLRHKIMPLLRVAACLSVGRNYFISPLLNLECYRYLTDNGSGSLGEFLVDFQQYEEPLLLYLFCKKYSEGLIGVDFQEAFFSKSTKWEVVWLRI
jgi:hypothetical protein